MQIYDDFDKFGANFCFVWVGNIMTPGFPPKSQGLKIPMDCRSFGFEDPERVRPLVGRTFYPLGTSSFNNFQVDFKLNFSTCF